MVTREVPLVGNSSLLFSWKNFDAFRRAFGIKSLEDFDAFYTKENVAKLTFDDIIKIVGFGLQRRDKEVSLEEVVDIIDEYMEENTFMDLIELVINAQLAALTSTPLDGGEVKGVAKKPPKTSKN